MDSLNLSEAKTHFSRLVDEVRNGRSVLICKRNVPFARIEPLEKGGHAPGHHTEIGWCAGGGIRIRGDLTAPAMEEGDWEMLS